MCYASRLPGGHGQSLVEEGVVSLHCHDLEEVLAGVCRLGMAEGGVLSPEKGCPQSSSARWKEKERRKGD